MAGASEMVVIKGNWKSCTALSTALILCPSWLALDLLLEKAQSWHPGMLFLWSGACEDHGHDGRAWLWFGPPPSARPSGLPPPGLQPVPFVRNIEAPLAGQAVVRGGGRRGGDDASGMNE